MYMLLCYKYFNNTYIFISGLISSIYFNIIKSIKIFYELKTSFLHLTNYIINKLQ